MSLEEKLKTIKRSFRPLMNGIAASSMRQKGTHYHLNWGVSQMDLQRIAADYGKDKELATVLWQEDIRECKILATLIMPPEEMNIEQAREWLSQIPTQEMAEWAAFHLFQHIDGIAPLALHAIISTSVTERICGYHILSRLFLKGKELDEASDKAFRECVETSLTHGEMGERHAAANCLARYER